MNFFLPQRTREKSFAELIYSALPPLSHVLCGKILKMIYLSNKPFATKYSAICTAFVAAPFLRLSETIHILSVFG